VETAIEGVPGVPGETRAPGFDVRGG